MLAPSSTTAPQPDVRPFLQACSVYVLPSYREGTPRTVLEAMATGRPIITTDAPGCRETVRGKAETRNQKPEMVEKTEVGGQSSIAIPPPTPVPCEAASEARANSQLSTLSLGTNGILIPPRNTEALAEAMRFFLEHPEQIAPMGRAARQYAEDRYDVRKVNAAMLSAMGL